MMSVQLGAVSLPLSHALQVRNLRVMAPGSDPPDILCVSKSGKKIGVELTKWLEHEQITAGSGRKRLEESYLAVIKSEKEPKPDRIGKVVLYDKSKRLKPEDQAQFTRELFAFIVKESTTPDPPSDPQRPPTAVPSWNTPQGGHVRDFTGFPTLAKYLDKIWFYPRERFDFPGAPWVMFAQDGGGYTPASMVQAAIDRIRDKIKKYQRSNHRAKHSLAEFDLLCFFCDEALLHNTPIHGGDFGFPELAKKLAQALKNEPRVFDRIFLFHPHEGQKVFCVYPQFSAWALLRRLLRTFAHSFFATIQAKWIDSLGTVIAIAWFFAVKNVSSWERFASFLWIWAPICAGHLIGAAWKVWKEISRPPAPASHLGSKLSVLLFVCLLFLALLSFGVQRAEVESARTFIYLTPTTELMECEKRAFFVKIVGPHTLSRVEVTLKDNKSGQTIIQSFPEIDPGPLRSDQYLWFRPSSPWDEDYTVTATSKESNSSQNLIVRGTQHQIQFATQVTVEDEASPALSCRDKLLPPSYSLAGKETRSCVEPMKLPADVASRLDVYSYQRPDGFVTVRKMRTLPSPSELDEQSDLRHLTDYQKEQLRPAIKQFAGSRLRVFYSGGPNTLTYAKELQHLFKETWKTNEVSVVPVGDERIIDVQITIGNKGQEVEARTLLDAFQSAGIKHKKFFSVDPDAGNDVVLWVGPKSPKNASPDQCGSPELNPKPGQAHNCDWIAQVEGICPFMPK
jgi:hypothetical protein